MKIAVVIPCRNEVKNIEECIRAIYASDLPGNCELFVNVVDGKSSHGSSRFGKWFRQTDRL